MVQQGSHYGGKLLPICVTCAVAKSRTILIKDINPGSALATPSTFITLNGTLFFRATDGIHGAELWQTDGTALGTRFVKDIYVGPLGSSITTPVAILTPLHQATLFFMANNGIDGTELWTVSQNAN
jgi:trimeric autotransporter adhesin